MFNGSSAGSPGKLTVSDNEGNQRNVANTSDGTITITFMADYQYYTDEADKKTT
ncbi:MAG: hypothetical protein Q4B09_10075 [Lachnospiraceae bacterium]|nr:hypothetical protein [Lachnospiraceae bacterium]